MSRESRGCHEKRTRERKAKFRRPLLDDRAKPSARETIACISFRQLLCSYDVKLECMVSTCWFTNRTPVVREGRLTEEQRELICTAQEDLRRSTRRRHSQSRPRGVEVFLSERRSGVVRLSNDPLVWNLVRRSHRVSPLVLPSSLCHASLTNSHREKKVDATSMLLQPNKRGRLLELARKKIAGYD